MRIFEKGLLGVRLALLQADLAITDWRLKRTRSKYAKLLGVPVENLDAEKARRATAEDRWNKEQRAEWEALSR